MQLFRSHSDRWAKTVRLAGCLVLVASIWLIALPIVGRQSTVRSYIERNERWGIDPSAKFYTELPAMPALYDRVEQAKRRHEAAFW
ncbi:MAG: hypothetical protein IT427_20390 [Pirellulales bacterium]|nr:hypothetical protein [Pirellulales bacterium]